jgi:RNA polymerase sigma-70 factor (ECF subfamily)
LVRLETELELVQLARKGDLAAFAELVRRYQDELVNYIAKFCGSFDDANDIAQEALVKAYTKLGSFKGNSSFKTWLYRIATNHCIDAARKLQRAPSPLSIDSEPEEGRTLVDMLESGDEPLTQLTVWELQHEVRKAVLQLPPKLRAVLVLHDLQGLQYGEIAEVVGIPLGTVKSRIHNAREQLKTKLHAYVYAGE